MASHPRSRNIRTIIVICLLVSFGVLPATLGYQSIRDYYGSQTKTSQLLFKGFALGWQNYSSISDAEISLWLNLPFNQIRMFLSFNYGATESGVHSFSVILPFTTFGLMNSSCGPSCITDWPQNSTHVHAMAVIDSGYTKLRINFSSSGSGYQQLALDMQTMDDLYSSSRGNDLFFFPSGVWSTSIAQVSSSEISQGYQFSVNPPSYATNLEVGISSDSVYASAHPDTFAIFPDNDTFRSPEPTQWFSWSFKGNATQPVSLSYTDSQVANSYEEQLYLGGILIGIGVSTIAAVAIELVSMSGEGAAAESNDATAGDKSRSLANSPLFGKLILGMHFVLVGIVLYLAFSPAPPTSVLDSSATDVEGVLLAAYSALFGLVFAAATFYLNFVETRRGNLVQNKKDSDPWFGELTQTVIDDLRSTAKYFIRIWVAVSITFAIITFLTWVGYLASAEGVLRGNYLFVYNFSIYSSPLAIGDVILMVLFIALTAPFGSGKKH